jgi:hypothetical protein
MEEYAAESTTPELAPHYYRENFLRLCDNVQTYYADLLIESEHSFLRGFRALSFTAQCLYIRLISRTGPWFRESRLSYAELGPLQAALDELLEQGFANEAGRLLIEELGALYTRAELTALFGAQLGKKRNPDKPSQLAAIAALSLPDQAFMETLHAADQGRIVAPTGAETVEILQLLFFGNRHQSLTEFVLSDLGVVSYYPYKLDKEYRQFASRDALQEFMSCAALSDLHYEMVELGLQESLPTLAEQTLALTVEHSSSEGRWSRLCNRLARDLERTEQFDDALALYARSTRHPCRERYTRVLERQGNWQAARQQCQDILAAPWCEEEAEAASRILPRVQRKLGEKPQPRPRDNFSRVDFVVDRGEARVELLTAAALEETWSQVHYVENSLMNTLFGLAFWQEIFAPVPGAFHHAYQSAPSDMYDGSFHTSRKNALAARLKVLGAADLSTLLVAAYHHYYPHQCRWVDWRYISAEIVAAAAAVIPAAHLLAIWQRMLFDPASNRSGFPDLIALGEAPGEYCLIEVKGPGDALQDSQKRWLRFFATHDVPAQVAWVQWHDD